MRARAAAGMVCGGDGAVEQWARTFPIWQYSMLGGNALQLPDLEMYDV